MEARQMRKLFLSLGLLGIGILGGCSYTGSYVTDVSSDGHGNLIIKKNTVRFRPLTGPFPIGKISDGRSETTSVVRIAGQHERDESIKKLNSQLAELQKAHNKKLAEIAELKAKIAEKEQEAQAGKEVKDEKKNKTEEKKPQTNKGGSL